MRYLALTVVVSLLELCLAIPAARSGLVVHERRDAPHREWIKKDKLRPATILPVRIGLVQSNLDKGHDLLLDVSHPDSPNYGKHWTPAQVHDMFAPSMESVEVVREWLKASGIDEKRIMLSDTRAWLGFDSTASEAGRLFSSEFYEYEHATRDQVAAACDSYSLPVHISNHVDYITPGVKLITSSSKKSKKRSSKRSIGSGKKFNHGLKSPLHAPYHSLHNVPHRALNNCDVLITPACIKALYQIPDAPSNPNPSNALGVLEYGDTYDQADLDAFYANYSPTIPQGTHPILEAVDGGVAPVNLSVVQTEGYGEALLDFELAIPLLYPQKVILFQTDSAYEISNETEGFMNTFLNAVDGSYCKSCAFGECGDDPTLDPTYPDPSYAGQLMCGVYNRTNVVTTSYGEAEADLPAYYIERQCNEYLKLGLQGVTFMFSSGDEGVGGFKGDASSSGCLGTNQTVFTPQFPSVCPYITSVGATKVYPGHHIWEHNPESAANDLAGAPYRSAYSSSGGFANTYETPSYQESAVASYFKKHNPAYPYYSGGANLGANGGLYNRIGRGIPDVSANGDNIATVTGGRVSFSGGTSASSPIFASVITLINEQRLAAGKSTVGFINPVLYANPHVLNDIVNGSNPNCGTNGFSAVSGWDPVTGLGTPNYPKMLELFMSLP